MAAVVRATVWTPTGLSSADDVVMLKAVTVLKWCSIGGVRLDCVVVNGCGCVCDLCSDGGCGPGTDWIEYVLGSSDCSDSGLWAEWGVAVYLGSEVCYSDVVLPCCSVWWGSEFCVVPCL